LRLLLIEDDIRIVEFLGRGLKAEGHSVDIQNDGKSGFDAASKGAWDAIILDVMLPALDGREVCRSLRLDNNRTPILMLTALDSTDDIVRGLRLGADDYMTKPFAFDELLARLESLDRRSGAGEMKQAKGMMQAGDLSFDRDALIVKRDGKTIELTSLEYALLQGTEPRQDIAECLGRVAGPAHQRGRCPYQAAARQDRRRRGDQADQHSPRPRLPFWCGLTGRV